MFIYFSRLTKQNPKPKKVSHPLILTLPSTKIISAQKMIPLSLCKQILLKVKAIALVYTITKTKKSLTPWRLLTTEIEGRGFNPWIGPHAQQSGGRTPQPQIGNSQLSISLAISNYWQLRHPTTATHARII